MSSLCRWFWDLVSTNDDHHNDHNDDGDGIELVEGVPELPPHEEEEDGNGGNGSGINAGPGVPEVHELREGNVRPDNDGDAAIAVQDDERASPRRGGDRVAPAANARSGGARPGFRLTLCLLLGQVFKRAVVLHLTKTFVAGRFSFSDFLLLCLGIAAIAVSFLIDCLLIRSAVNSVTAEAALQRTRRAFGLMQLLVILYALFF